MIAFDPHHSDLDADTERMVRVSADDREAFDELVRRNFDSTVRIISSMMGTSCDAEDIAQDVFLRVFRYRHRYLPTAKFSTFLGTIIRNAVLNAKRSHSRRRIRTRKYLGQQVTTDGTEIAGPYSECDPVEALDELETAAVVRQAIGLLPRRQQIAIELVDFRGLTYLKAAERMSTSRKAVKSLLGRGRKKLGETLLENHRNRFETES